MSGSAAAMARDLIGGDDGDGLAVNLGGVGRSNSTRMTCQHFHHLVVADMRSFENGGKHCQGFQLALAVHHHGGGKPHMVIGVRLSVHRHHGAGGLIVEQQTIDGNGGYKAASGRRGCPLKIPDSCPPAAQQHPAGRPEAKVKLFLWFYPLSPEILRFFCHPGSLLRKIGGRHPGLLSGCPPHRYCPGR